MTAGSHVRGRTSRLYLVWVAVAMLVMAAACAPATPARSPFVGMYLADNRPHELIDLDLAGAERSVTGAVMLVVVDEQMGTQLDRYDVRGSGDGNILTLAAERFLGRDDTTLTVTRS